MLAEDTPALFMRAELPLLPGLGEPCCGLRFNSPLALTTRNFSRKLPSAFQGNNGTGLDLDLFNSEIKVTRKYYGSYLCGLGFCFLWFLLLIFFFLATSFFAFDGPVIPRTVYATDPACIQSCY